MRKEDVQCKRIAQESGILTLTNNEELISNIIEIVPSDPDRKFHVRFNTKTLVKAWAGPEGEAGG